MNEPASPAPGDDRRHRLEPFCSERIAPFTRGRRVTAHSLLTDGKNHSNYRFEVEGDSRPYVLRLYPPQGDPAKEFQVMEMAREAAVPVPRVLAHGRRWAVLEFAPGQPLAQVPQHTEAAAHALAALARVTFERPGWLDGSGEPQPWPFDAQGGFTEKMLAHPQVSGWLGTDRVIRIRQVLAREKTRLAEIGQGRQLVHGDFNPGNILIHEGHVSAVLDWEYAHAGSPWMDVANLRRNLPEAFHPQIARALDAAGRPLPPDWHERAELMDLGSHLEFLTSPLCDAFKQTRVDRVDRFLECMRG